jgi:hypothetical protein
MLSGKMTNFVRMAKKRDSPLVRRIYFDFGCSISWANISLGYRVVSCIGKALKVCLPGM